MVGVDRSHQNIGLNRNLIQKEKWYFPMFSHCIDMVVQNAWQIHRLYGRKMFQLTF